MKITRKNLERLFKNCEYNPEKIGIALLKMEGYKVTTHFYSDSVYVEHPKSTIENPKILYYHYHN